MPRQKCAASKRSDFPTLLQFLLTGARIPRSHSHGKDHPLFLLCALNSACLVLYQGALKTLPCLLLY